MPLLNDSACGRRPRCRTACILAFLLLLLLSSLLTAALAQEGGGGQSAKDEPTHITFGETFKVGKTSFSEMNPAKVAPMPRGYVSYRNEGFKVETDAVVVGPHVIDFAVPSVSDSAVFGNLRVLCAIPDKVDEKLFWIDCTIDSPEPRSHDFSARRVSARTEGSNIFALALRDSSYAPPPPVEADLAVEVIAPAGRAVANRELSFEVSVTNRGPGDADDIKVSGAGFSSDEFVSASGLPPANGRCKQDGSNYACKLDRLAKGETAVLRLVLRPSESPRSRPTEPRPFYLDANAFSQQPETNIENNHGEVQIEVWPDPNAAPRLKLLNPAMGSVFTAPAEIKLSAEASDPDGKVAKVEFYDEQKLIGAATTAEDGVYTLVWTATPPGPHLLTVVVTDDGGRSDYESTNVFVNGAVRVGIMSPRPDAVFNVKAKSEGEYTIEFEPLSVEAKVAVAANGRNVKEVVFALNHLQPSFVGREQREVAKPAGVSAAKGEALYTATFKGLTPGSYSLTAIAVDEEGIESISRVPFKVNASPLVWLKPARNAVTTFKAPASIPLVATLYRDVPSVQASGKVKVDFYADGKLIGSVEADGFIGVAFFLWKDAPPGTHTITAIATDSEGAASVPSGPLRVTVQNQ
jgi:hypothetical protein